MSKKINKILDVCADNDLEIISFGLAPNPFGFCYEGGSCLKLDNLLDSLTGSETKNLRTIIFGGSND